MGKIIVDSRETNSGMAKLLLARGIEVVSEELECGDYLLAQGVAVERKAAQDFVASIFDRRLFSQILALKSAYARPFFIVEGDLHATRSAISEDALLGALSYISLMEGVPVLMTNSTAQTAALLVTMHRHATEGLGYDIPLRGAKPKDRKFQAQFLVEGLPSIGPSAAKKLLEHFGSAAAVLAADAEALRKVPGIGPKTIEVMRAVLAYDVRS